VSPVDGAEAQIRHCTSRAQAAAARGALASLRVSGEKRWGKTVSVYSGFLVGSAGHAGDIFELVAPQVLRSAGVGLCPCHQPYSSEFGSTRADIGENSVCRNLFSLLRSSHGARGKGIQVGISTSCPRTDPQGRAVLTAPMGVGPSSGCARI
jgi:hypothetical protein